MDIYDRLEKDHITQRKLCEKIEQTSGDTAERRKLWETLRVELEAHASAGRASLLFCDDEKT